MKTPSPNVLLISAVDTVGAGRLPRLLFDAGYRVHLLASERIVARRSRFVESTIWCPPGPTATMNAARDHLAKERRRYDDILMADEPVLWAALDGVAPHEESADWLRDWFPVPLSSACIDRLRSKTVFLCESRDAEIRTPVFAICSKEDELWHAAESIGFPLFIKATQGWAGSGLVYARTKADLEAQRGKIRFESPVLVQQEIQGEPGSVSVLYDKGLPVCWFAYLMTRTWPNRFSSACMVRLFPHSEAAPLVQAVGRLTRFTGFAGIDFVWDRQSDSLALLEFNPRPTPVYHLGRHAGVDFSRALEGMRTGNARPQRPNGSNAAIGLYPQSLYYALEQLQPLSFLNAFRDAPWAEPALTAAYFRRFVTHYLPKVLKDKLKS